MMYTVTRGLYNASQNLAFFFFFWRATHCCRVFKSLYPPPSPPPSSLFPSLLTEEYTKHKMAKSRKGFAQANGRKKARLARADTKRKKIAIKKSERISVVKVAADEEAREREEQKAEGTREGDDADWTDIGSVTTGGGLRMTPVQREKARLLTRKQAARKVCYIL